MQPASGSDPCAAARPAWLGRWLRFEQSLAKEAREWEWVQIEKDDQEEPEKEGNSQPKPMAEHVTNLATLARLHGLEEENFWVFEFGEEEGIDEMHDRLGFDTESVASEVPWKGEVLQVHQKVSPQPTKKEVVRFLFRGPGVGLGFQRVHGGSSLMEWYLGLQRQGLVEDFDGYFTTLGGKILDFHLERSWSVWCCKRWFSMEGFGTGRLVVLARWRSLILGSGSAPFAVLLTVGTLVCRAIVVGPIVIGSLAVQALGVLGMVVQGRGVVGPRSSGGSGFIGQGGVGAAMGGICWFGPNWS